MKRILIISLIFAAMLLSACAAPSAPKNYIYNTHGKIEVGGDGEPIELINNPNATNPTYAELLAFIKGDRTDEYSYIVGPPKIAYVSSDFAETVHNNAEAAGIRAAWVGIEIEGETEGQALNAFETTDIGLVYIDCEGKGPEHGKDSRAYVEIGKRYAIADIDDAKVEFNFLVSTPMGIPSDTMSEYKVGEQTLRSLEELGWIRIPTDEEQAQRSFEELEWIRTHDIVGLGQTWMQEWIREHEAELCGREFKSMGVYTSKMQSGWLSTTYFTRGEGWYIRVDCIDTSWFQPEEKLIEVDGVPIVWKVSSYGVTRWAGPIWAGPFKAEIVKDIDIHW